MSGGFPVSLKISIPLLLLGFATTLSIVNALYNLPRAERDAEEDARKHVVQELSRLQSTLEYLLLKGDVTAAQHQVAAQRTTTTSCWLLLATTGRRSSPPRGVHGWGFRCGMSCRSSIQRWRHGPSATGVHESSAMPTENRCSHTPAS